jgi:hypothetical protein
MADEQDHPPDVYVDRAQADEALLRECRFEAFRGPGPGGQKRNKTSSAVRLTHVPSGLSAMAGESRSQHRNRAAAVERLRHRLAVELRRPVDWDKFVVPDWFATLVGSARRLRVPGRDRDYLPAVGLVLDVLSAAGGSVSAAAGRLGVTTGNLVDFLQRDEAALTAANRIRAGKGLKPLGGAA